MMMVSYIYAVEMNKMMRSLYPGKNVPYSQKQMHEKLSEVGKHCLSPNPARFSGEPYYAASCFRPGITELGTDNHHHPGRGCDLAGVDCRLRAVRPIAPTWRVESFYIATPHGTWQKLDSGLTHQAETLALFPLGSKDDWQVFYGDSASSNASISTRTWFGLRRMRMTHPRQRSKPQCAQDHRR